jgi:rubrerythrin
MIKADGVLIREWYMVAIEHEKLAWDEYRDLVNRLRSEGNEEAATKVIEIMNEEAQHRVILEELLSGGETKGAVAKVRRGAKVGSKEIEIESERKLSAMIDATVAQASELRELAKSLVEASKRAPDRRSGGYTGVV